MKGSPSPIHRQQGVALVLVLWLVALLTVVAASFATHSKVESRLSGNAVDRLRAELMAESGISRAIMELLVNDSEQRWNLNGQIYQLESDQGVTRIAIRSSSGLLDLNKAPRELLERLFILLTEETQQREALVDRLSDWRDSDDLRRLKGAEDEDYHAAGYTYATAGRDLASIDELAYVMGFDAAKVNRLRPHVTLYSDSGGVDYRFASEELTALLKDQVAIVDEITDALAQIDSNLADLELPQGGGQAAGKIYRIQVEAVTSAGARAELQVDIELRSQDDKPYTIRSWYDS
ncbi:MAG: general secretion pathway protein GspK [Candidatus Thiodiazotropha sp. (ex Epidulcina cf. delphinae)]|nr:general secretion pathway protein GspK [Candidatus Thiodiazotropha sp. (ex Epidulcina cf. delphinae)]